MQQPTKEQREWSLAGRRRRADKFAARAKNLSDVLNLMGQSSVRGAESARMAELIAWLAGELADAQARHTEEERKIQEEIANGKEGQPPTTPATTPTNGAEHANAQLTANAGGPAPSA
jgi:hypothetical protein